MLPLLPQLFCALAEKVSSRLIAMDPAAAASLTRLQGRQLAFRLEEWPATIVLTASSDTILFNQHEDAVDCRIATDLASLRLLRDPSQLTRLIKADVLQIDGDIQVAQQYSHFFQKLSPDWQQSLSGYVGDAMAHKIALTLTQLQSYISSRLSALEQSGTALAQDELLLTPTAIEMAQFSDAVSRLAARVEQLQLHIARVQES
ncbi:MAG: SCP2 sterol-binding domain-containing protein [Gammaproteobacteria bacterium]|nr:SCP2 sterol-binding domain-containing protein [Gammaproteobacteria bacterium]MBU1557087.1 SCP2 sterol-binding domain-containing protein [Gammaproteobacteria bacterium]MBU2070862.1 SCP2 sterol-binding domain-containing protein [Gammaproteobacteria bacterium]MBU2185045.1 SCP2 sterol-binding domain-containing protein [Gammaproteobacteria bacterium]MBU2204068.1 SCP2 sterol-binding domain-containing protein [Gammaproteobacteria bacterium]